MTKTPKIGFKVAKIPLKVLSTSWFKVRVRSYPLATAPKDI